MDNDVEIKLSGSGLDFLGKVTLFQATQIIAFVSQLSKKEKKEEVGEVLPLSNSTENISNFTSQFLSPREAIDTLRAQTNPQKIVAFALYLGVTSKNGKLFTAQEIITLFSKAGEKTPKNIKRDLKEAVSSGYIYPEDDGNFRLLSPVDSIIQEGFKKVKKRYSSSKKTSTDSKKSIMIIRKEVEDLPIATSIVGFPKFFDLKMRADKILWILIYAKKNAIDGLNRNEIINFAKKIGGKINSGTFTSSNIPNIKNDYIYQKDELIYINSGGEVYLQNKMEELNKNGQ